MIIWSKLIQTRRYRIIVNVIQLLNILDTLQCFFIKGRVLSFAHQKIQWYIKGISDPFGKLNRWYSFPSFILTDNLPGDLALISQVSFSPLQVFFTCKCFRLFLPLLVFRPCWCYSVAVSPFAFRLCRCSSPANVAIKPAFILSYSNEFQRILSRLFHRNNPWVETFT